LKIKTALLAAALCAALPVVAQTSTATPEAQNKSTCPIHYKSIVHGKDQRVGTYLTVTFTNTSDKTISLATFGVVIYNEAGKPHDYMKTFSTDQSIKPGKGGKISEEMPNEEIKSGGKADDPQHRNTAEAYVMSMKFTDGTKFVDDGSKKCASPIE
jgi:hypothetical protein